MRKIAVFFISAVTALTSFVPAQAFPTVVRTQTTQSDIVQVGDHAGRQIIRKNHRGNGWDRNRNNHRRDRWDRDRRNDRHGYYRNDRRYRNNNAGAIIGGLAAGAIIGGAIASQPRYSNGNSHTQACYARYRSYRASDNTYQPNYGPRRQCN
ncbi:BA14K family protein [Pararhizobium sp.]|uniref:BA14K family protein n=1 Tax=Pararhizobium sp. TaxID=1977563 RepID=UPI003D124A0D